MSVSCLPTEMFSVVEVFSSNTKGILLWRLLWIYRIFEPKKYLKSPLLRSFHYFNIQNTQYFNDICVITNYMQDEPMFSLSNMFLKQFKETQSCLKLRTLLRKKPLWTMCWKCFEYIDFSHYGSISWVRGSLTLN